MEPVAHAPALEFDSPMEVLVPAEEPGVRRGVHDQVMALSSSAQWEEAKKEWYIIAFVTDRINPRVQCPCGAHLVNQVHLYNPTTKHKVVTGLDCCKQMGIDKWDMPADLSAECLLNDGLGARASLPLLDAVLMGGAITAKEYAGYLRLTRRFVDTTIRTNEQVRKMHMKLLSAFLKERAKCGKCKKDVMAQVSATGQDYWYCCRDLVDRELKSAEHPCCTCGRVLPLQAESSQLGARAYIYCVVCDTRQVVDPPPQPVHCVGCKSVIAGRVSKTTYLLYYLCCNVYTHPAKVRSPTKYDRLNEEMEFAWFIKRQKGFKHGWY